MVVEMMDENTWKSDSHRSWEAYASSGLRIQKFWNRAEVRKNNEFK